MESKSETWRVKVGIAVATLLIMVMVTGSYGIQPASASTGNSAELSRVTNTVAKTRKIILDKYATFSPSLNLFGIGNEWTLMGLARDNSETSNPLYQRYYDDAVTKVTAAKGEFPHSSPTDYAREIIALTALGYDPADIGGYNLFEGISDYKELVNQGVNSMSFALIAATLKPNYDFIPTGDPETATTKERLVGGILGKQFSSGLWMEDPDWTAMALQALAQVKGTEYDADGAVTEAIDKAVAALSKLQNDDGSFSSWDMKNSSSSAQVLAALSQLGISPTSAEFTKGGRTVVDDVLSYFIDSKGFEYDHGHGYNGMANEQCYYALISYRRYLQGENRLYDMSDTTLGPVSTGNGSTGDTGDSESTGPGGDTGNVTDGETDANAGTGSESGNQGNTEETVEPGTPAGGSSSSGDTNTSNTTNDSSQSTQGNGGNDTSSVIVQYAAPRENDMLLALAHQGRSWFDRDTVANTDSDAENNENDSLDSKNSASSDWDFEAEDYDESASSTSDTPSEQEVASAVGNVSIPLPWVVTASVVLIALIAGIAILAVRLRKAA